MSNYFKKIVNDNMFKKLFRNAGILLSGNIYASIFALFSLAITARALGPELFGTLVLIETFILIVDGIVNLQSFQAIIKYGSDYLEENKKHKFNALIKFGYIMDFSTAILGTVLSIIFISFFSYLTNINYDNKSIILIYSFVILFHVEGTPTAILRIFDRFNLLAIKSVIQSTIKLIGVSIAYVLHGHLLSFVLIWVVTDIASNLLLIYFSLNQLRKNGYKNFYKSSFKELYGQRKNFIGFVLTTNINSTVRMLSRQFDVLIIGGVLGNTAAGFYKMSKQFSSILSKLSDPLYHAIYPQLTRLKAQGKIGEFRHLTFASGFIIGGVALLIWSLFIPFGSFFIKLTVGADYLGMYNVLITYMFAIVMSVITFPLQPSMLALGKPNLSLIIQLISTLLYFAFLYPLLQSYGILGAGLAYIIYYLLWSVLMYSFVYRLIRKELYSLKEGGSPL